MQLGISTYSFPWAIGINHFIPPHPLTPFQLLQFASERDILIVQFGDNLPLHQLPLDELKNLKNVADSLNIKIQVGTRKLTVENVLRYISIATLFETDFIRIVIDEEDYRPTENEVIPIIITLIPYLKEKKLHLAIENHDRFPALSLRRIIQSTDPDCVAICLDTANSLGAGEGLSEIVSVLGPHTLNLHIKDFTVQRLNHKMGFRISGCTAGAGIINIPVLVDEIKKHGRCSSAILEIWSDPEATIEDTILKEKTSVEKSIEYLKTIIS